MCEGHGPQYTQAALPDCQNRDGLSTKESVSQPGACDRMCLGRGPDVPETMGFYNNNSQTKALRFTFTSSGGLASLTQVWDSGAGNWDWNRSI